MSVGYLYLILFNDDTIKVGMTTAPETRFRAYTKSNICNKFVSVKCSCLLELERKLILHIKGLCGSPARGRELFGGGIVEFSIVRKYAMELSESNATKTLTTQEIECLALDPEICGILAAMETVIHQSVPRNYAVGLVYSTLKARDIGLFSEEEARFAIIQGLSADITKLLTTDRENLLIGKMYK